MHPSSLVGSLLDPCSLPFFGCYDGYYYYDLDVRLLLRHAFHDFGMTSHAHLLTKNLRLIRARPNLCPS